MPEWSNGTDSRHFREICWLSAFEGSNPSPRIEKMFKKKQSNSQKIKTKARENLSSRFDKKSKRYVIDTSTIVNKFLTSLVIKGLNDSIIIPNAVMAELENLANKGKEAGFIGLEELSQLQKFKKRYKIKIFFQGPRPDLKQIRYAKSGEIDALIRDIALKNKAILITADLVQAKSAQAYGLEVLFLRPRIVIKKKKFLDFLRRAK